MEKILELKDGVWNDDIYVMHIPEKNGVVITAKAEFNDEFDNGINLSRKDAMALAFALIGHLAEKDDYVRMVEILNAQENFCVCGFEVVEHEGDE